MTIHPIQVSRGNASTPQRGWAAGLDHARRSVARVGILISNDSSLYQVIGLLTRTGCEALFVDDPETATEFASLSAIIVDEDSVNRYGEAFFRRKQKEHPHYLPLLLLLTENSAPGGSSRAGYDDVLRLPLQEERLRSRLESCLRQRAHSESKLIESEHRFNSTFDLAPVSIAHTTLDGRFIQVNRRFCEMLGYSERELINLPYGDVTDSGDIELSEQKRNQLLRSPGIRFTAFEKRYRRKDGSVLWANLSATLVHDPSGQPQYFIAVAQDITERKRIEEAMRESERFARSTIDALPSHICVVDETGEIIAANQAWRDFAASNGALAADVSEGADYLSACDAAQQGRASDTAGMADGIRAVLAGERGDFSQEYPCYTPAGQRWFRARVTPFSGEGPRRAVISHIDTTDRKQAEAHLLRLAYYDAVTSLPNRALLKERLKQALAEAESSRSSVGVLFVELDRFKLLNDTLGHEMGDQLLQKVADRLARCLDAGNVIGRLGGDEFAVIVHGLDRPGTAARTASKLMSALAEPIQLDGMEIFVTGSTGIALYPADGTTPDMLINNADIAMYRARELGRNSYQFFTPEMNTQALMKLKLGNGLKRALERNELFLHYQPQLDLKSGRVVGAEALLRWNHPALGVVSPGDFIPVAEETGLIVPIGEWALRTACAQNKAWQDLGLPPIIVSVNLSARQFTQNNVVHLVGEALDRTGLEARYLELELTESMMMDNAEDAIATLDSLKALGVHVSIDDFGTGYSNLGKLERFPLDTLKIDRSFIKSIDSGADRGTIAKAVIRLAHGLGFDVVAEGVETETQRDFLQKHGCDVIQGYYVSPAMPAADFAAKLLDWSGDRMSVNSRQGRSVEA